MSEDLTGVILAAGKGTRMAMLPSNLPKAALPILDQPIIYHHLSVMVELGIRKVHIVVGHRGFEIVREIERKPDLGLEINYVNQEETLGIAHSVGCLEPHIHSPFLLFLGDIYIEAPRIAEMVAILSRDGADAVLGAVVDPDQAALSKNFIIITDDTGRAVRVIEKPRYPRGNLKGVGVYLFSPAIFDAIRRTPRTAMRDEYEITDSIQIMIEDGYHVRPSVCIDADLNVTFPADLLQINLRALQKRGMSRFIADGVRIEAGAVVEESVIGENVRIGAGARVKRSLVFRGAVISENEVVENAVVTEMQILRV